MRFSLHGDRRPCCETRRRKELLRGIRALVRVNWCAERFNGVMDACVVADSGEAASLPWIRPPP